MVPSTTSADPRSGNHEEDIVRTWGLTKRYGDFEALAGCSGALRAEKLEPESKTVGDRGKIPSKAEGEM